MNRKSLILTPDQSILIPTEVDGVNMRTSPVSRRSLLQRGGALALSAPMGIAGTSLLVSAPAHAGDMTLDVTHKIAEYTKTINGQYRSFNVFGTSNAGQVLIVIGNGAGTAGAFYRSNNVLRAYNGVSYTTPSGVYRRYRLTSQIGEMDSGLLDTDIDGGRRLADVDWNNPAGSSITNQGDLSNDSDALTLFWEVYRTSNLVTYSGAILRKVTNVGTASFTHVLRFSGANHNTFVNKRVAYSNAVANMRAAQGRYRTTLAVAGVAATAGLVGAVFSLGAGTAVLGGALATLAGNAALNGQALVDASATVSSTWHDMVAWVEGQTGENLVR